jgi:hypothetical protein
MVLKAMPNGFVLCFFAKILVLKAMGESLTTGFADAINPGGS